MFYRAVYEPLAYAFCQGCVFRLCALFMACMGKHTQNYASLHNLESPVQRGFRLRPRLICTVCLQEPTAVGLYQNFEDRSEILTFQLLNPMSSESLEALMERLLECGEITPNPLFLYQNRFQNSITPKEQTFDLSLIITLVFLSKTYPVVPVLDL